MDLYRRNQLLEHVATKAGCRVERSEADGGNSQDQQGVGNAFDVFEAGMQASIWERPPAKTAVGDA